MSEENKKDLTEQVEDSKISFKDLSKKGKSSRFDKITTLVLLLICIALALYVIFGTVTVKAPEAVSTVTETSINVSVETAEPGLFQRFTRLNGEIGSDNSDVSVLPDTSGTVSSVLVRRGDSVAKDQVIAYIDPSRPGQSYKESPVTSPVDGIITAIPVSIGETVSASTPVATISGDKTLYIEASLPERYTGTAEVGMSAYFTSVAYPGEQFEARLSFISPSVNTANRTSDIELEIVSGAEKLKEGMFVTIDLVTEEQDGVITVPSSSLTSVLDGSIVYTVVDGKAVRTPVETGSSNDTRTVITSGIEPGDTIITAGTVSDGSSVNIL